MTLKAHLYSLYTDPSKWRTRGICHLYHQNLQSVLYVICTCSRWYLSFAPSTEKEEKEMTSPAVGGTSFAPSTKKRRSVDVTCSRWYVICTVKRRRKAMTSPAVGCVAFAPSKEEKSDDVTCSQWYLSFAPDIYIYIYVWFVLFCFLTKQAMTPPATGGCEVYVMYLFPSYVEDRNVFYSYLGDCISRPI